MHAAGVAHRYGQEARRASVFAANTLGVQNVMAAAAGAGVKHVVLISSVSVYGQHPGWALETDVCRPDTLYGQSKLEGERIAGSAAQETGLGLTILRLATVHGEGDPGNIGRLMRAIDHGRFLWIGSGENEKSLIYVEDVARACLAVVREPHEEMRTYNVCVTPCTMREVVDWLAAALGRRPRSSAAGQSRAVWGTRGHRGQPGPSNSRARRGHAPEVAVRRVLYDGGSFRRAFGFAPSGRACGGVGAGGGVVSGAQVNGDSLTLALSRSYGDGECGRGGCLGVMEGTLAIEVGTCVGAWLALFPVRRWLTNRGVLDAPNERSSHWSVRPRGGGLVIVVAGLAGIALVQAATSAADWQSLGGYCVGAAIVAVVSWVDDVRSVHWAARLTAQGIAAAILIGTGTVFQVVNVPGQATSTSAGWGRRSRSCGSSA